MPKSRSGFTIVELLIVIVVIGILAAITIVAYNGIQQRGRNAQTVAGAKQYIKAIHMYAAVKGSYPTSLGCLGEGYDYAGTSRCGSPTSLVVSPVFDSQIGEFLSSKPQLSTKNLTISTTDGIRAGGYYNPNVGGNSVVYYILEGQSESCAAGGGKTANSGVPDMYCAYTFPVL